jgi:hypothetical protein
MNARTEGRHFESMFVLKKRPEATLPTFSLFKERENTSSEKKDRSIVFCSLFIYTRNSQSSPHVLVWKAGNFISESAFMEISEKGMLLLRARNSLK